MRRFVAGGLPAFVALAWGHTLVPNVFAAQTAPAAPEDRSPAAQVDALYSRDLITDDDVMSLVSRQQALNFRPNEKYGYSNTGYTLLAQIVKRVSGQPFREFTTSRIFNPLGMHQTHFRDDFREIVPKIAYGYEREGDVFKVSVTNFNTVGATSLLSTVEDLRRWDENFYHPVVGGAALVTQMLQQGVLNDGEKIDYEFGVLIENYRGLPTVRHSGSDAGYRAELVRFPNQHFSVACLCNVAEARPREFAEKIADIYLAKELSPVENAADAKVNASAVRLSDQALRRRAGTYLNRDAGSFYRIVLTEGQLSALDGYDRSIDLVPVGEGRFHMSGEAPAAALTFIAGSSGTFKQVMIAQGNSKPLTYDRVPEYTPSESELTAYTGTYRSEELEVLHHVTVENGTLMIGSLKNKPTALRALTKDIFSDEFGSASFGRDSYGRVSGFDVSDGRIQNIRFVKLP